MTLCEFAWDLAQRYFQSLTYNSVVHAFLRGLYLLHVWSFFLVNHEEKHKTDRRGHVCTHKDTSWISLSLHETQLFSIIFVLLVQRSSLLLRVTPVSISVIIMRDVSSPKRPPEEKGVKRGTQVAETKRRGMGYFRCLCLKSRKSECVSDEIKGDWLQLRVLSLWIFVPLSGAAERRELLL